MDWIFDHLQYIIAAAAAVAYWLNQRKAAEKEKAEADKRPATRFPRTNVDESQDAEQARRIREEIRRKIAERTDGRSTRAPAPLAPPLVRNDADEMRRIFHPEMTPTVRKPLIEPNDAEMAAVLERQRKLKEQMDALEFARLMEKRAAHSITTEGVALPSGPRTAGAGRGDLGSKDGLRRAIILREILGPPVALR